MRLMYKYLVYILVLGSLSSCAWQHTNTKTAAQNEYDFEASILHPEYYVYHMSFLPSSHT